MSAPRCQSVDATSRKEESDLRGLAFGGRSCLGGTYRGMWMSRDENRDFAVFGLSPCDLRKSRHCGVKVSGLA